MKVDQNKILTSNLNNYSNNTRAHENERNNCNMNSVLCSLDSNAFSVNQEKCNNLAILELTDYYSIELDDSIDYIEEPLKRNNHNKIDNTANNRVKKLDCNYLNKPEVNRSNYPNQERNSNLNSNFNNYGRSYKADSLDKRTEFNQENSQKYIADSISKNNKEEKRKENIDSINRDYKNKLRNVKFD